MSYLDRIIKQSPWLLDPMNIKQDVHLSRLNDFPLIYHEKQFLDHKFADGVYIVTGPRQIGKSTHLKLLIQQLINEKNHHNFLYFNCDLLDKKQDVVELVETYLTEYPAKTRRYLLLDEITSVKGSFLAIKFLIDSGHYKNLTYVLTGSNTINIKKTGEYLPGRRGKGIDFHFSPLSFKSFIHLLYPDRKFHLSLNSSEKDSIELSRALSLEKQFENYLITGGFPRVINEFYLHKTITDDIFTIYRTWLTSEIAKSDKREYIAKLILERCLISLGSDISYNAFAQDSGVGSHNTIYDYIDFFESTYVLSQIYNFDLNQKKVNYRKNKKIYFNDPFIYAVIEAWLSGKPRQTFDYLKPPTTRSQLIENLVYLKLKEKYHDIYFYREQNEIDFVVNDLLLEVKYQNKIIKEDYKGLIKYPYQRLLITKNTFKREADILLLPVTYFMLWDL